MIDDPIERVNLGMSAGAVALSWVFVSQQFAASVAVGAAVEVANFRVLRGSARRLFGGEFRGGAAANVGFGLRFLILGAVLGACMYLGAHPIGLLIGVSAIVPAVVIAAWWNRPPVEEAPPGPPPDDESWDDWDPWLARERAPEDED